VTSLLPRQKWALAAFAIIGVATGAAGAWEYHISGAVHEFVLGTVMLLLVALARLLWTPRPERVQGRG